MSNEAPNKNEAQSLVRQSEAALEIGEKNSMLTTILNFVKRPIVKFGLFIIGIKPVLKGIYELIDAYGNIQTAVDILKFFNTGWGTLVLMALGFGLIAWQLFRQQKRTQPSRGAIDSPSTAQAIAKAKEPCPDKWLHNIAEEHKKAINRYVDVTDIGIANHELLRDDSYVEFSFVVSNGSVYPISLGDLRGSLYFQRRLLSRELKWIDNEVKDSPIRSIQTVTLRQSLSREDVIYILNSSGGDAKFEWHQLDIVVKGGSSFPEVIPKPLIIVDMVTNEELLKAHPKLKIEIKSKKLSGFYRRDENLINPSSSYVLMEVSFDSSRATPINIRGFKLTINAGDKTYTSIAETDEIYDSPFVEGAGSERLGEQLNNLNKPPILVEQGQEYDGWLRFVFKAHPDALDNRTATLAIADVSGEEHPTECLLQRLGNIMN
jgi:hypothetical protein